MRRSGVGEFSDMCCVILQAYPLSCFLLRLFFTPVLVSVLRYEIVEAGPSDVITWSDSGKSFLVVSPDDFSNQVPMIFLLFGDGVDCGGYR